MNSQLLQVRADTLETVLTIVDERLDLSKADEIKASMKAAADRTGADIAVDMRHVTFVDSSGLGALVALYKHIGTARRLQLSNVSPGVMKLLKLTKLDRVFEIR